MNDLRVYKKDLWQYMGQYQIVQMFHMTPTQWNNVKERVKVIRCRNWFVLNTAKRWCAANDIALEGLNFRNAVDEGMWRFDCLVIKCIGFDYDFYQSLPKKGSGTKSVGN
jgi:hypothetical protein